MSEKEIIIGILKNDEKALRVFYHQYHKMLYGFIHKQIQDVYLVEEIVQDVFLDFIEQLHFFRGNCSLKTFLFSIARHKIIDCIRKKKVKKVLFSTIPSFILDRLTPIFLDDEIEKQDLVNKINRTFKAIPNDYCIVLRLKYIEDKHVSEIARQLSISFKAAESMLFRARKAFIKAYKVKG